jgi:hypothetical protein
MVSTQLLEALDRDGFAVIRDVVPESVIVDLREWVQALVDDDLAWRLGEVERRRKAGETDVRPFPRGQDGTFHLRLDDMARRDALTDSVAKVAAAIGTPSVGGGGIAACMPGWGGHSGLHQDLGGPAPAIGEWDGALFTWPLTAWEGMRVVAGSHRRPPVFDQPFAGAIAPHPDEVHIDAGPGDVVVNSIHVWKSGTLNRSRELRSEIWIGFKRDESLSQRIADYWATTEIMDGASRYDPGDFVVTPHDLGTTPPKPAP